MSKSEGQRDRDCKENLRLYPQLRLCARFDSASMANFPVASEKKMGFRVLDNCAEEHIM